MKPKKLTWEERKAKQIASGRWKEGPDGSLVRVNETPEQYQKRAYNESLEQATEEIFNDSLGLPSDERVEYLSNLDRPLTESEAREYSLHSLNPSAGPNLAFSMISSGSGSGAAVDVLGNAMGYAVKKGGQFARLLKSKEPHYSEAGRELRDELYRRGVQRIQERTPLGVSMERIFERIGENAPESIIAPALRALSKRPSALPGMGGASPSTLQQAYIRLAMGSRHNKKVKGVYYANDPWSSYNLKNPKGGVPRKARKSMEYHADAQYEDSEYFLDRGLGSKDMFSLRSPVKAYRGTSRDHEMVLVKGQPEPIYVEDLKEGDIFSRMDPRFISTTSIPETASKFIGPGGRRIEYDLPKDFPVGRADLHPQEMELQIYPSTQFEVTAISKNNSYSSAGVKHDFESTMQVRPLAAGSDINKPYGYAYGGKVKKKNKAMTARKKRRA